MMKVLYDSQIFSYQRFGGISNCFVQLISHLPDDVHYRIAVEETDNIHLRNSHLDLEPRRMLDWNILLLDLLKKRFKGRDRIYSWFDSHYPQYLDRNRFCSIRELKRQQFDVFHPTFYDTYFLPYIGKKPFVLTVHDMIPEILSWDYDPQVAWKRKLVSEASHIIAVSNKTKADLMDLLHVPDSKISVIYHGSTDRPLTSKPSLVDYPYILYVGQRNSYKNFLPMLESLSMVIQKYGLSVICTGPSFTSEEETWMSSHGLLDRVVHMTPTDDELFCLYSNAQCFIYPSLYEGFGIPILEAYQANCPVLLNRKSCFPEIAGDAAIYFNLDESGSDLNDVFMKFMQMDDSEKDKLLLAQKRRLSLFSWKKSAEQLSEVYRMVLQS